jgi:hypothetical protein
MLLRRRAPEGLRRLQQPRKQPLKRAERLRGWRKRQQRKLTAWPSKRD